MLSISNTKSVQDFVLNSRRTSFLDFFCEIRSGGCIVWKAQCRDENVSFWNQELLEEAFYIFSSFRTK